MIEIIEEEIGNNDTYHQTGNGNTSSSVMIYINEDEMNTYLFIYTSTEKDQSDLPGYNLSYIFFGNSFMKESSGSQLLLIRFFGDLSLQRWNHSVHQLILSNKEKALYYISNAMDEIN